MPHGFRVFHFFRSMTEDYVLIGTILKPHGVAGEVAIKTFTHDDERFLDLERVLVRNRKGEVEPRTVESARLTARGVLLKLAGCDDMDAADLLRNHELVIPESERPPLPNGRAYFDQVIGMTVVDDETGEAIGSVRDVMEMPAGDVFVLDLKGAEHLVTNAGGEVRKIDTTTRQMRVTLLAEYGAS